MWSHRGRLSTNVTAPENTLEAFRAASAAGVDGVELDVWLTVDGEWVVHHDRCREEGRLDELRRSDIDPRVPCLSEALEACAVTTINVELKVPDEARRDEAFKLGIELGRYLESSEAELAPEAGFLVSSFSPDAVEGARTAMSRFETGFLVSDVPDRMALTSLRRSGHSAIHPEHVTVNTEFVRIAHEVGLRVVAWTADEEGDIRRVFDAGVDAVISNVPLRALAVRPAPHS
ncbi:MAG: glycerophosphodiester phosphodiesterase [Acidimicrobiales bacterium]